jgi:hypothetical protein
MVARCALGMAMSPCGKIEPSLSVKVWGNKDDIFLQWIFISTNAKVVELMLPFVRTDTPLSLCRIQPAVTTTPGMPGPGCEVVEDEGDVAMVVWP